MNRRISVALVAMAMACAPRTTQTGLGGPELLITDVSIVDVAEGRVRAMQSVVVRGDSIVWVGDAAAMPATNGNARRIDGSGKYLIPGLWDMHVHFMNAGVSALPLLVAHGVTGVREMGGHLDSTRRWQARMRAGTLIGPRIVTPGPIIESPQYLARVHERDKGLGGRLIPRIVAYRIGAGDSASAYRAIDSLVELRVDFVKMRNVGSPDAYRHLVAATKRAGLALDGHLPGGVGVVSASDAGQRTIEHTLLPLLDTLPAAERRATYERMARNGTWYTPTLAVGAVPSDSAMRALLDTVRRSSDPRLRASSRWFMDWWRLQLEERAPGPLDPRQLALIERQYRSTAADVRGMRDAGVRILAGTDAGSLMVFPGSSMHDELARLVRDGGLTPREALWAATLGPATLFGRTATMGSITAGRVADLVLLDADPLADITNTRRIAAVIAAGRLFDHHGIQSIHREAERLARP